MFADGFEELKAACALIDAGKGVEGTGYLVAPDVVVTCEHVIRGANRGDKVDVHLGGNILPATLTEFDEQTDCAYLTLKEKIKEVTPLPLAGECRRKVEWDGYGYPGLAKGAAVPLNGIVMDPKGQDKAKRASLILYSPQVAAGMAANVHGFSGSPVMVERMIVGHLTRILGDDENPGKAAYGYLYAVPSEAVLKLLGVQPAKPFVDPGEAGALEIPSIRQDEYHVLISCISRNRKLGAQLVSSFNIAGFKTILDVRDQSPADLNALLKKSKTAVVLIGKRWLASDACREWAAVLAGPRDFRVIPMIVDDCELPPEWQGIPAADWRGLLDPQGPSAERLLYTAAGQRAPVQIVFGDLDETPKRVRLYHRRLAFWRAIYGIAAVVLAIGLAIEVWDTLHRPPAPINNLTEDFRPDSGLNDWDYPPGQWQLVKDPPNPGAVVVRSQTMGVPKVDGAFYDFNCSFEAHFFQGNMISWAYRVQPDRQRAYVFQLTRTDAGLTLNGFREPGHHAMDPGHVITRDKQCCTASDVIKVRSSVQGRQFKFGVKYFSDHPTNIGEDDGVEYRADIVDTGPSPLPYGNVGLLETDSNAAMLIAHFLIRPVAPLNIPE